MLCLSLKTQAYFACLDQLLLIFPTLFSFNKTNYLNEEVNCTEPSPSVSPPWFFLSWLPAVVAGLKTSTLGWCDECSTTVLMGLAAIRCHHIQHNDTQHNDIQHNNWQNMTLIIMALHHYAGCHLCWVSHVRKIPLCWMSLGWVSLCWVLWRQH